CAPAVQPDQLLSPGECAGRTVVLPAGGCVRSAGGDPDRGAALRSGATPRPRRRAGHHVHPGVCDQPADPVPGAHQRAGGAARSPPGAVDLDRHARDRDSPPLLPLAAHRSSFRDLATADDVPARRPRQGAVSLGFTADGIVGFVATVLYLLIIARIAVSWIGLSAWDPIVYWLRLIVDP